MLDQETITMLGLDCANTYKSMSAGAIAAWVGLDILFARLGFSRRMHWALSGVAIDYYCREKMPDKKELLSAAGLGFVGGFAVDFVQASGFPPLLVGPMSVVVLGSRPTF